MMAKKYFYILGIFIFVSFLNGCETVKDAKRPEPQTMRGVPVFQGHNREILATDLKFDQESGRLEYTLPEDAYVRVRIGLPNGGALLRTLVDWEKRSAGHHMEVWNKKDTSGQIDFSHYKDIMIVLMCVSQNSDPADSSPPIKGSRRSPEFEIAFPNARKTKKGLPIFKDAVSLRVVIQEEDFKWLTEAKYEIAFFIDNIFLNEDEEGTSPYNYLFSARGFNGGEHILTANVVAYSGETAAKSIKIFIEK